MTKFDYANYQFQIAPIATTQDGPWDGGVRGDEGRTEVRVREGGRAVLPCRLPNPVEGLLGSWRHGSEPVPPEPRYHLERSTGSLVISRARPSDSGLWSCGSHSAPVHLIVLEPPKPPYLMIDKRRLDAGNQFVPVKENSALSVECVTEGGAPPPGLHWLLLPPQGSNSPGLALQTTPAPPRGTVTSGVAVIPSVRRAFHNSTVACIVTHPTLPAPLNASILLDVQFTPSFAISRVPGFGYPVREGMPVSLKCDVESNPSSVPVWQKDDGAPPVEQSEDGFLNFTSIKREHSGWYKCTTRHLLSEYSSIGYYLSVRYGEEADLDPGGSTEAAMEVSVGGAVQLDCGGGGVKGCWGRVDPSGQVSPLGPGAPLTIHSVLYQQAGQYKCYAPEPDRLNLWRTHNVHLKVTGAPMVVAHNTSMTVNSGDDVTITAEFCCNPQATRILWLLPTARAISPGSSHGSFTAHNITGGNWTDCHKTVLRLEGVGREHMGDYSLLVWSGRGIGQATITVNVTGARLVSGASLTTARLCLVILALLLS